MRTAAVVWTILGLLACAASVQQISQELRLPAGPLLLGVSGIALLPGALTAWEDGQPTWILLYPMTRAWIAFRHDRHAAAGLWIGTVVAVKPFFALSVLLSGLVTAALAGATAGLLSVASIAVTGWQPWVDWLALSGIVTWLSFPGNASIAGFLARLVSDPFQPLTLRDLPTIATAGWIGSSVLMLAATAAIPRTRSDERWLSAFIGAILISPLGWTYYIPLLMGPAIAWWWCHWRPSPLSAVVFLLNWTPFTLFLPLALRDSGWLHVVGSIYTAGLLGAWALITYAGLASRLGRIPASQ
jgi:hypothetical protein